MTQEHNTGEGVRVKPLEWKGPDEHTAYGEQSGGFIYTVMSPNRTPGWRVWVHLKSLDGLSSSVGGVLLTAKAESLADAMAVAQADYERRILSCLDLTPSQPTTVGEAVTDERIDRFRAFVKEATGIELSSQLVERALIAALAKEPRP